MSMDKDALHDLIAQRCPNICGLAAMKGGQLLLNDYWHGFQDRDAVNIMSVTKSVVSLLLGIAAHQGLLPSLDQPVLDFFPEYQPKRGEKTIRQVTLEHLLTMTAPYKYKYEPWSKVCSSDDWTKAALDLLGGRAGLTGAFKYSTLGLHILSGVLARISHMPTIDFANRYLFAPLGIATHDNYQAETAAEHKVFTLSRQPRQPLWFCDPQEVNTAGWGLCLSVLDMVKLGQLCLNKGVWEGRTLLDGQWLARCAQPLYQCGEEFGHMAYGRLWWIPDASRPAFAAIGNSGNVIYVDPEQRITVAVTALFDPRVFDRVPFIQEHILPLLCEE